MDTAATFHDQVIKDKQITGMMPVLQSRVLTCKESVDAYLQSFHPFASLWQSDLASVYAAFLAKNPQLEVKHTYPESAFQYEARVPYFFFVIPIPHADLPCHQQASSPTIVESCLWVLSHSLAQFLLCCQAQHFHSPGQPAS